LLWLERQSEPADPHRAKQRVTIPGDIDVAIVGAGAALATRLARDGFAVLILERTRVHVDRIRGEWLAPWGVREAAELGVLDVLVTAGGHFVSRTVRYGEGRTIEESRAQAVVRRPDRRSLPGLSERR
jgi:2-polyprenyl-6-methoxyphenol hydroxylase-like FAD-dependent oxidoreductase